MRPRSSVRVVKLAALATAVGALIAGYVAASAPAGNRDPSTFKFDADPGPSSITFGQNVAYKAEFSNPSKSNWLRVNFSQSVPYALLTDGSKLPATLVYSSCELDPSTPPVVTGTTYSCPEIASLPAHSPTQRVTLVWHSSMLPTGKACASPCRLTTFATLAIKEQNPSSNDTFNSPIVYTSIFDVPDKDDAGGYPIQKCTDPANPTLVTNLDVGAPGNPMATKVCAPTLPANLDGLNPGLATTILERGALPSETKGTTQVSVVCIADVGLTCPDTPSTAFPFPSKSLTLVFIYDNFTYGKITQMFENNQLVSSSTSADPNCQITYDNPNHLSIATCHSSKNGPWRGG